MGRSQPATPSTGVTRRGLLASAGGAAIGIGIGATAEHSLNADPPPQGHKPSGVIPFYGTHQAGIATPTQNYLQFASFDLATDSLSNLRELLVQWTRAAATLTQGHPLGLQQDPNLPPQDPGEALGLPPSSLTITIGLGPSVFEQAGHDRLGLRAQRPTELNPLPPFQGESLDPSRSNGDLCLQVCAEDPQVAFHAVHTLARLADSTTSLRWLQAGFGRTSTTTRTQTTPRNLMGFKDGTNNIHAEDTTTMNGGVWVSPSDQPAWMRGGSYLILRRIRMLLDVWDATTLNEQERVIGRKKLTGAPLGAKHEHDPVPLDAETQGAPTIPEDAHIRQASARLNHGQRILRRGYSYSDGYDPATGQLDAGLIFIAYQRSPSRQFIPIQRRLATHDALNHHTLHTASAIFAIPPGAGPDGYIGETLL